MKRINALLMAALFAATAGAQTYTVLYDYPGTDTNDSGIFPPGLMSQGQDGDLYGTVNSGGGHDFGSAFKITTAGQLTTVYSFCAQTSCLDGGYPLGGLTLGTDGNLYGTTQGGGHSAAGTIFKLTPTGTLAKLWGFTTVADAGSP